MKMKKLTVAALLLVLCLLLSGCRARTRLSGPAMPDDAGEQASDSLAGSLPEDIPDGEKDPDKQEKNGESRGQTKENPEASRKEYDENRPAEILPGTERTVHESGEGSGFSGSGRGSGFSGSGSANLSSSRSSAGSSRYIPVSPCGCSLVISWTETCSRGNERMSRGSPGTSSVSSMYLSTARSSLPSVTLP